MIRILHIIGGMNQGGAENFLMNLYRNIAKEKIQFDFLVNREGIFDDEIKSLGGRLYYIPALQKVGQIKYTKNLDNFFKTHKEYKIVHSHINQVSGLILERAKKAGIPIRIAHSHNSKYNRNLFIRIYKKYLGRKILKNANVLVACSDKARECLYKKESKKVLIINNGIDIEKFKYNEKTRRKIREKLKFKDNEIVVGHVGRFEKQKNHKFLIKIFYEFNKINQNSKLLLVGDGKLKNKIDKLIKKYKLEDKVILLGNRKDVNDIYQAMDLFVFPSLYEGLPLVLIEAQISGLNVLISNNITKMVNITENVKFLSIKENPKVWAEEMLKIKKIRKDESKNVEKAGYDIKTVTSEYINLVSKKINALN